MESDWNRLKSTALLGTFQGIVLYLLRLSLLLC